MFHTQAIKELFCILAKLYVIAWSKVLTENTAVICRSNERLSCEVHAKTYKFTLWPFYARSGMKKIVTMKSAVDFTCRNKNYVSNRLCLCDESACVTFKKHLNCFPVSTLSHSCIFLKKLFLVGNYFGFVVAIQQQTLFSYRSFLYTWEFKKRTNKFLFSLADVKQMNFAYLL